jgi:hypothetical protein
MERGRCRVRSTVRVRSLQRSYARRAGTSHSTTRFHDKHWSDISDAAKHDQQLARDQRGPPPFRGGGIAVVLDENRGGVAYREGSVGRSGGPAESQTGGSRSARRSIRYMSRSLQTWERQSNEGTTTSLTIPFIHISSKMANRSLKAPRIKSSVLNGYGLADARNKAAVA